MLPINMNYKNLSEFFTLLKGNFNITILTDDNIGMFNQDNWLDLKKFFEQNSNSNTLSIILNETRTKKYLNKKFYKDVYHFCFQNGMLECYNKIESYNIQNTVADNMVRKIDPTLIHKSSYRFVKEHLVYQKRNKMLNS
jgi:hypothetical protein